VKKLLPLVVAVSAAVLATAPSSLAVELPSQASPTAEEHTHGPDGLDLDPRGRRQPAAEYAADKYAPWDTAEYDGKVLTGDAPDLTTLPTFHAIYIHPSDKPSRFGQYAAMFQADARDASALLSTLYGRGIRFDERTSGTTTVLDITVFRSKYNSKQLATTRQFSLIAGELANVPDLNKSNKKYFAWLDAGSQYCGQGNLAQDTRRSSENQNEAKNLALVYRPYSASDANGGFCRGRTLRHELGHTMGALQSAAPNDFDGAHCKDDAQDTMCYVSETSYASSAPTFDYNNDDYWDPVANPALASSRKLGHWTVNLSKYICPTAGCGSPNTPEF
jgi:hypothetical protein